MLTANDVTSIVLSVVQFLIGVPCNALIIAVYGGRKPQTTTNLLIICRAVVDIVAALIAAPLTILYVVTNTGSWFCSFITFQKDGLSYSLMTLTVAVAFNRFIIISKCDERTSKKRGAIAVACSISTSVLLSIGETVAVAQHRDPVVVCQVFSHKTSVVNVWMKTVVFVTSVIACLIINGLVIFRKHVRGTNRNSSGGRLSAIREGRSGRRLSSPPPRRIHVDIVPTTSTMTMSFTPLENHSRPKTSLNPRRASTNTDTPHQDLWANPRPLPILKSSHNQQELMQNTSSGPSRPSTSKLGRRNHFSESNSVSPLVTMSEINKPCQKGRAISASSVMSRSRMVNFRRNCPSDASSDTQNTAPDGDDAVNQRIAQEQQTTVMMFAVTIFLILSWIPTIVFYHIESDIELQSSLIFLVACLPQLNHFVCYFIYALTSPQFNWDSHNKVRSLMRCGRQQEIQLEI